MQIITSPELIIDHLSKLRVGQTAFLKCDRNQTRTHLTPELCNGYRFRTFQTFDDGTSQVKMRDKSDQNGMIGDEHKFYESCFSNDENSLELNLDNMDNHDGQYFTYSKLVIIEVEESRLEALIEVQECVYNPTLLEAYDCPVWARIKAMKEPKQLPQVVNAPEQTLERTWNYDDIPF